MNEQDVIALFKTINGADSRREFTKDDVEFWTRVARYAGWNLDAAREAVTAHYADKRTWIMPADITAGIRARRETNPWVGTRWV